MADLQRIVKFSNIDGSDLLKRKKNQKSAVANQNNNRAFYVTAQ